MQVAFSLNDRCERLYNMPSWQHVPNYRFPQIQLQFATVRSTLKNFLPYMFSAHPNETIYIITITKRCIIIINYSNWLIFEKSRVCNDKFLGLYWIMSQQNWTQWLTVEKGLEVLETWTVAYSRINQKTQNLAFQVKER